MFLSERRESYVYDGPGRLASVTIADGRPRTVTFVNDLQGQAIKRDEKDNHHSAGDPHEIWYRFGGRELGFTGNNGTQDTNYTQSIAARTAAQGTGAFRGGAASGTAAQEFDPSLQRINSYRQGSAGGSYTVRAGDTLAGIAAMVWGDASLWYKIAEANGLSGSEPLSEGRILSLPAGIQANQHNAATFKPYDAADALGETSPVNPTPTARKKNNKCGAFGAIITAVITVAVAAVLSPLYGIPVIGPVVHAAATNLVSQGIATAVGLQDRISWKQVGISAITAGVSKGIGAVSIPGAPSVVNEFATGALVNATTQGIAVATGLQKKFDWAGVAAAGAVSAAGGIANRTLAGAGVGGRFGTPEADARTFRNLANRAGSGLAAAIAGGAARSLITGTSFGDNVIRALPDVIGTTIGNGLAFGLAALGGGRPAMGGPDDEPMPKGGALKQMPADQGEVVVYGNPLDHLLDAVRALAGRFWLFDWNLSSANIANNVNGMSLRTAAGFAPPASGSGVVSSPQIGMTGILPMMFTRRNGAALVNAAGQRVVAVGRDFGAQAYMATPQGAANAILGNLGLPTWGPDTAGALRSNVRLGTELGHRVANPALLVNDGYRAANGVSAEYQRLSQMDPLSRGEAVSALIGSATVDVLGLVATRRAGPGLFGRGAVENAGLRQTGSGTIIGSAEEAYDAIRASTTDIASIAHNTGYRASNIQRVKDHLFMNEHLLDRYESLGIPATRARFDSDTSIAESWRRLETGTHGPADLQLLRHETAEAWYMRNVSPGYNAAHNAAQRRFPAPRF